MKKLLKLFAFAAALVAVACGPEEEPVDPNVAITTTEVTDITENSAKSGGNITHDGGATITSRGVCYGTEANPTIEGTHTKDGNGAGEYVSTLTDLVPGTTYYVRAYATNVNGITYGNEVVFSVGAVLPVVTTKSVTDVTTTSAVVSGNVGYDGGSAISEYGICYATTENPTVDNTKVAATADANGNYSVTLENLASGTTYYARAYATNGVGTAYGAQVSFTPEADPVIAIADPVLKAHLLTLCDANADGEIVRSEALTVTALNVGEMGIASFSGLENFTNLVEFVAINANPNTENSNKVASIDFSNHKALKVFKVNFMPTLTSLNLAGCEALEVVEAFWNALPTVNLEGCANLIHFHAFVNGMTSIDLSDCVNLQFCNISENPIAELDVTNNTKLVEFYANSGAYTSLDISNHTDLVKLDIALGAIESLNVQGCEKLEFIWAAQSNVKNWDLSNLANLKEVWAHDIKQPIESVKYDNCGATLLHWGNCDFTFSEWTFENLPNLTEAVVWNGEVTKAVYKNCPNLRIINLDISPLLTELVIENCPEITRLNICMLGLTKLDVTGLLKLEHIQVQNSVNMTELVLGNNPACVSVFCHENTPLKTLDLSHCAPVMNEVNANTVAGTLTSIVLKEGQVVNNLIKPEGTSVTYVQ